MAKARELKRQKKKRLRAEGVTAPIRWATGPARTRTGAVGRRAGDCGVAASTKEILAANAPTYRSESFCSPHPPINAWLSTHPSKPA
jgi:hypothetical protein